MAVWAYQRHASVGISEKEVNAILDVLKRSQFLYVRQTLESTNYRDTGVRALLYKLKSVDKVKIVGIEYPHSVDIHGLIQYESVKRWTRNLKDG
jgi:hypothetical protein